MTKKEFVMVVVECAEIATLNKTQNASLDNKYENAFAKFPMWHFLVHPLDVEVKIYFYTKWSGA